MYGFPIRLEIPSITIEIKILIDCRAERPVPSPYIRRHYGRLRPSALPNPNIEDDSTVRPCTAQSLRLRITRKIMIKNWILMEIYIVNPSAKGSDLALGPKSGILLRFP